MAVERHQTQEPVVVNINQDDLPIPLKIFMSLILALIGAAGVMAGTMGSEALKLFTSRTAKEVIAVERDPNNQTEGDLPDQKESIKSPNTAPEILRIEVLSDPVSQNLFGATANTRIITSVHGVESIDESNFAISVQSPGSNHETFIPFDWYDVTNLFDDDVHYVSLNVAAAIKRLGNSDDVSSDLGNYVINNYLHDGEMWQMKSANFCYSLVYDATIDMPVLPVDNHCFTMNIAEGSVDIVQDSMKRGFVTAIFPFYIKKLSSIRIDYAFYLTEGEKLGEGNPTPPSIGISVCDEFISSRRDIPIQEKDGLLPEQLSINIPDGFAFQGVGIVAGLDSGESETKREKLNFQIPCDGTRVVFVRIDLIELDSEVLCKTFIRREDLFSYSESTTLKIPKSRFSANPIGFKLRFWGIGSARFFGPIISRLDCR